MSLDILSKDILLKADKYKEEVEKKFFDESSAFDKESKRIILEFKNKLKTKYDIENKFNKDKILGVAKRDAKRLILETKSDLMDETFNKTYDTLLNLDSKKREDILSSLLSNAKKLIEFDLVECSKNDLKFIKDKLSSNTKIKIKAKDDLNGLLFYSNNMTEKLDFTFKAILIESFEKEEDKIQNILFN